jgi:biotin carboxylase
MYLPLVVKPVDNMGARGCRMVRNASEIPLALTQAVKASQSGRVIIESYMGGPEYSVDALIYDNTLTITGFADRHIYFPPYFIEMGHTLPAKVSAANYFALVNTFARGVAALGLSHGAAKGDVKLTKKGPMIGEIAGRLSGGYMSGWTFPYAADINLTREALLLALGKKPEKLEQKRSPLAIDNTPFALYQIRAKRVSAERAWISIPGTVTEILGIKKAGAVHHVRRVIPRIKEGDVAVFPRNNVQKGGNVIAVTPWRFWSQICARKAASEITLILTPFENNTDHFLGRVCPLDERDFPPDAFGLDEKLQEDLVSVSDLGANARARCALPDWLEPHLAAQDWNGLTLGQALARFDRLRPSHPILGGSAFWGACVRGSLQGMLYMCDCAIASAKGEATS